jgi:hypothetical protein
MRKGGAMHRRICDADADLLRALDRRFVINRRYEEVPEHAA